MPILPPFPLQRACLVRPASVQARMHCNYGVVLQMITAGNLVAFDVGLGNRKRCLRIFESPAREGAPRPKGLTALLSRLLPDSGKSEISCIELGKIISCTRPHVLKLCRRGMIVGRVVRHRRLITIASARQFLAERHLKPETSQNGTQKRRSKMPQDVLPAVLTHESANRPARTNGSVRQRPCSTRQTPNFGKGGDL